ncbi:putative oxidoreductase CatD [Rubripirellula amarantea]|uniref:Putative oxidoreductase CatD n=2 Tax=Rubripirellula amarantea TaxID=2527999 RepID=A0A5C5WWY2_9BACT|nr:putative oxidoreductase CatD [Rubripirellula amarantea]
MSGMFSSKKSDENRHEPTSVTDDLGKLVLRVTIGGLMLLHGLAKLKSGVGGIEGMLEGKGLPTFIAYGVYVGEIVVPILMALGVFTRISALIFAFNMVVAIYLAHAGDLFSLGDHGGWAVELAGLYLFGAVAIALLGPGRFALKRGHGLLE